MHFDTLKRLALGVTMATALVGTASAQHVFDGNILFGNTGGTCIVGGSATFDACGLIAHFPNNDTVDPQLVAPLNIVNPNWQPLASSPASSVNDAVVSPAIAPDACGNCPSCVDLIKPTCYRGAIPPVGMGDDWTQGWTDYTFNGAGRVIPVRPVVILQGDQFTPLNLVNTNHYLLRGRVDIESGASITIEAGTYVFGENATVGTLVIERGAQIFANGTVDDPIIFTPDTAPGSYAPGQWGGVVINGRGIANCADCINGGSCVSEGTAVAFCGNNDCDNSGSLEYARVEFAGRIAGLDNELNAWTFNGVGCNTRVNHLQAHRGLDDLFEWFGGNVNCSYLVGTHGQDDGLDWQMGYRGQVQFAVIQQLGDASDKAIEADNNEFNFDAPCRSLPTFANLTLVGSNTGSEANGIHLRRGTDARIYNSIVMNWRDRGLRVQHNETSARGFGPTPAVFCGGGTTNVDPEVASVEGLLIRTFPNPAVNEARFFFSLPASGRAELTVFDAAGRMVERVLDGELAAGEHTAVWNVPTDRAAGAYFYRLQTADKSASGRLVTTR